MDMVLLPGGGTITWTRYYYLDKVLLPAQGTITWTRYYYLDEILSSLTPYSGIFPYNKIQPSVLNIHLFFHFPTIPCKYGAGGSAEYNLMTTIFLLL